LQRALDYEREVYRNIDLIFTMSDQLRGSFVEDFGIDERKVVTIGAGVNLERMPALLPDKDYDSKKILFIGVDFERKGGEVLLRAFRAVRTAHPRSRLLIIGPHQLNLAPELADGVDYFGFLTKSDPAQRARLDRAFAEASLFVMPSLYEPFGIAPLEAMLHGIPAVLTAAWAFPEMVIPGMHGELVESGDSASLAETIDRLLRDPVALKRMGLLARERVLERFTWPAVVSRLREVVAAQDG
jgi:glycosyltransferase involved in cell wall biosynthesis